VGLLRPVIDSGGAVVGPGVDSIGWTRGDGVVEVRRRRRTRSCTASQGDDKLMDENR